MKQLSISRIVKRFQTAIALGALGLLLVSSYSFTLWVARSAFTRQFETSRADAEQTIARGILGGYVEQFGQRTAKIRALGRGSEIAGDQLVWANHHKDSPVLMKEHLVFRMPETPQPPVAGKSPETPEDGANAGTGMEETVLFVNKMVGDVWTSVGAMLEKVKDPGYGVDFNPRKPAKKSLQVFSLAINGETPSAFQYKCENTTRDKSLF